MIGLWLSVRGILRSSSRTMRLDSELMSEIDGIHVDVHPYDPPIMAPGFAAELQQAWPQAPYDLHFIEDRVDADTIVHEVANTNPRLRRVYGPSPRAHERWGLALAASDIVSGSADTALKGRPWLLVTAPTVRREPIQRVELSSRALARVAVLAGGQCDIVLDRDVDGTFATDTMRRHVAEIVVGKAILGRADAAAAASALRRAWRISQ